MGYRQDDGDQRWKSFEQFVSELSRMFGVLQDSNDKGFIGG